MSDQDLFEEDKDKDKGQEPNKEVQTPSSQTPNYDQMLAMIVNDEGSPKYKSVDDALKGAAFAQAHIAKLEQELAELRNGQGNAKKIEDVLAALQAQKGTDQIPSGEGENKVSPTDIQEVVKNVMMDINNSAAREQNVKTVTNKFKELYGEKASETLYGKANDLGMSREDINGLIAKNPVAALKLLGVDSKNTPLDDIRKSSVNTEQFNQKAEPEVKSVMGYVKTKDLVESWKASKEKTNKRLGLTT